MKNIYKSNNREITFKELDDGALAISYKMRGYKIYIIEIILLLLIDILIWIMTGNSNTQIIGVPVFIISVVVILNKASVKDKKAEANLIKKHLQEVIDNDVSHIKNNPQILSGKYVVRILDKTDEKYYMVLLSNGQILYYDIRAEYEMNQIKYLEVNNKPRIERVGQQP